MEGGGGDDEDGCGVDEVLRAHLGALKAAAAVDTGLGGVMDACERLLARASPARDHADAQCIWALFARPSEHWHARTRGQARTGLFEIATVALGVFANARILRGADPVVRLHLPAAADVAASMDRGAGGSGGDDDDDSDGPASEGARATNTQTARGAVEQMRRSLHNTSMIRVLGSPEVALPHQLRLLGDLTAWEYRLNPGVNASEPVGESCLPDDEHVRLRAEVVNWLMAWRQIATICAEWRLGAQAPAADDDGDTRSISSASSASSSSPSTAGEDAWMRRRVDVERTITRSDQYMRRSMEMCAELLAPAGIADVYRRVFPNSAPVTVQTMLTRLVPAPAFALVCTRCVREYNGLRWADPVALAAAESFKQAAAAAATTPSTLVASAPITSLYPWTVRLAPPPAPITTGAEIRRSAAAVVQTATAVATGARQPVAAAAAASARVQPTAVAVAAAAAAASGAQPHGTDAAAANPDDAIMARQRTAPLPQWARSASEDAWVLQAWFAVVDRQMTANGTGAAATKGGAGVSSARTTSTCRERYFMRTCDPGALDRARGRPVVGGQRPLPTVWYAMPGALAVHCHVCGRTTEHTTARSAVNAWLREVRGPCHRGGDEFGQALLI